MCHRKNPWFRFWNKVFEVSAGLAAFLLCFGLILIYLTDDYKKEGLSAIGVSFFFLIFSMVISSSLDREEEKYSRKNMPTAPLEGPSEFQRRQMEVNNDQWLHTDAPPPIGGKKGE